MTACLQHINCENTMLYRNPYSNIQNITVTRIHCYIGIICRILTDSYRMNKREYGLHVFIESIYSDIQESYSKNILGNFAQYSPIFHPNTEVYRAKKPVFTVALSSEGFHI